MITFDPLDESIRPPDPRFPVRSLSCYFDASQVGEYEQIVREAGQNAMSPNEYMRRLIRTGRPVFSKEQK
jgi:hypothetical protein